MTTTEGERLARKLQKDIEGLQEMLRRKEQSLEARFGEISELTRQLEDQRIELEALRSIRRPFRGLKRSKTGDPFPRTPWYSKLLHKTRRRIPVRAATRVRESYLFDADWYLAHYPDLATNKLAQRDPARHYLQVGAKEGRNPGPDFDTQWYLRNNPDVKATGVNPLFHYLRCGMEEGRTPRP